MGWVECVGIADRACYDLEVHAKRSKKDMVATHRFDKPREMEVAKLMADKGKMGRTSTRNTTPSSIATT